MKKIIDNKLYDTDNAEMQFEFKRVYPDFTYAFSFNRTYYDCKLYKTSKGNYFITGVEISDEIDKKEIFKIISEEEVKNLSMEYSVDKYIELFGEVEEG